MEFEVASALRSPHKNRRRNRRPDEPLRNPRIARIERHRCPNNYSNRINWLDDSRFDKS